jgi:hypothetical protein
VISEFQARFQDAQSATGKSESLLSHLSDFGDTLPGLSGAWIDTSVVKESTEKQKPLLIGANTRIWLPESGDNILEKLLCLIMPVVCGKKKITDCSRFSYINSLPNLDAPPEPLQVPDSVYEITQV